jgi:hypothetical protein
MSALPPGPVRRRPGFVTGLVIGLLVATVGILAWALATRSSGSGQGSVPASASSAPSLPPSLPPKQSNTSAVVRNVFNKKDSWSKGARLSFAGFWVPYPNKNCKVHTYALAGKTRGAFLSDCASWEPDYDILLFEVGFENTVTIVLRHLVLTDRYGNTYAPVNVRSHATYPPYFLNETQKLPPGGKWSGWVTFDGRVVSLVPAKLSYIDNHQTLVQVFAGKPNVVQASG